MRTMFSFNCVSRRVNAALGSNFASTVLLTTVTLVGTQLSRQIVAFERWHPRHVTNVRNVHIRQRSSVALRLFCQINSKLHVHACRY